jgi:trehalose/maltose hydrolase-like predicted phosphorylase
MLSPHAISAMYDDAWEICVKPQNQYIPTNVPGVFVGNGKIGMIVSTNSVGAEKVVMTHNSGSCAIFNTGTINISTLNKERFLLELKEQCLDMYSGIVRSVFAARNGMQSHKVQVDTFVAKHMPYTFVQTVTLYPADDMAMVIIEHEIAGEDQFEKIEYNNNTVFHERANGSKPIYLLTAKAKVASDLKLAACCSYVSDSDKVNVMGFGYKPGDKRRCCQRLHIYDLKKDTPVTFHVVTTQLTTDDCKDPLTETKRIHVNMLGGSSVASGSLNPIAKVRANHVKAWSTTWQQCITIEGKAGATAIEKERIKHTNMMLRHSLFSIWCSVCDTVTACSPFLDMFGSDESGWDMWIVPLLVMWRPGVAKTALERRHDMLQDAIRLAAGYGCAGCKFSRANEGIWDSAGLMHVYDTALITINIWNFYRTTMDKNWLSNRGYAIMKNSADFLCSRTERNGDMLAMTGVISLNLLEEDNNTMTNYLTLAAVRYTIEASFELGMSTNPAWHEVVKDLVIPMDAKTGELVANSLSDKKKEFELYDHLIPLLPLYSDVFERKFSSTKQIETIEKNIKHTLSKTSIAHAEHPFNLIIIAWLQGLANNLSQADIDNILSASYNGAWQIFDNNIHLAAMFVAMVLTSVGTARMCGSVTETRFYNEKMGIKVLPTKRMPLTWKGIKISGLGTTGTSTYHVVNSAT